MVDKFIIARFNEEILNHQIQSYLELGLEYFEGGTDVQYNEEDIKILASLLIENSKYHIIDTVIMKETHLSNQGLRYLTNIAHLKCLRVGYNDITDEGLEAIGENCKDLIDLDISGNLVTSLEPLYKLENLRVLAAGQTLIKDCDDSWLKDSSISFVYLDMTLVEKSRLETISQILKIKVGETSKSRSTSPNSDHNKEKNGILF